MGVGASVLQAGVGVILIEILHLNPLCELISSSWIVNIAWLLRYRVGAAVIALLVIDRWVEAE